jgi:hypothetical protein
MKRQIIIGIVCLGLLMWTGPTSAQSTYSLKVTHHRSFTVTGAEVDKILDDASKMLQKNSGHVNTTDNVACDVTFTRKGSVDTFAWRRTPAIINTRAQRDAVYREESDVKIVDTMNFCRKRGGPLAGCTWPPRAGHRSMIVVRPRPDRPFRHLVWAHEFGHRTGLRHRSEPQALMTVCPLRGDQVQVNRDECNCLVSGPRSCIRRDPPDLHCSTQVTLQDIVRSAFVDHFPHALISRYGPGKMPELVSMLHDASEQNSWANVAAALGLIGNGEAGQVLKDFIESDPGGVHSSSILRPKTAALLGLGYLLNRTNDTSVLSFLIARADPHAWEKAGPWIGPTREVRRSHIEGLQESAMAALALSGHPEAGQALQNLAANGRKGLVEDLMQTHSEVSRRGLAEYYAPD